MKMEPEQIASFHTTDLHPLIRKLENSGPLTEHERDDLNTLPLVVKQVGARQDIVREGDSPGASFVLLDGVACAFKVTEDARRQVLAFHIRGDLPDLQCLHLPRINFNIGTITACKLGFVPHEDLRRLCHRQPRIADLLWRESLTYAAIFREWITNIGQRQALSRAAHLICEHIVRANAVGLVEGLACVFPMTQEDLADAMGLSVVHVNRILQELRKRGLIVLENRRLLVPDWGRLQEISEFDPGYLQLGCAGARAFARLAR